MASRPDRDADDPAIEAALDLLALAIAEAIWREEIERDDAASVTQGHQNGGRAAAHERSPQRSRS